MIAVQGRDGVEMGLVVSCLCSLLAFLYVIVDWVDLGSAELGREDF